MGQEIVYCSKCAERLMGSDFDKGKAFRVGDMSVCLKCARELLPTLSAEERKALTEKFKELELRKSSGNLQAIRPSSTQVPIVSSSSSQIRAARSSGGFPSVKAQIPSEAPQGSSKTGVIVAVVIAVLGILIALLAGGRSSSRTSSRPEEPDSRTDIVETPGPRPGPAPAPPPPSPPSPAPRRPEAPTPLDVKAELGDIDREIAPYVTRGEYGAATNLLSAARPRHLEDAWFREVSARLQKLDGEVRKAFTPLLAQAEEARKKENLAAVAEIRAQVKKWGLESYLAEFDGRVAPPLPPPGGTDPVLPAPAPPVAPPPALVKAFLTGRGRDYDQAAREADQAADQEGIRLAAAVPAEAFLILGKWPRGWNLAATVTDAEGNPEMFDEPVVHVEGVRAQVRGDRGTRPVEFGEITPASLAEIFRGRAAKKESDPRAAAYFCAIEGDPEAAKRNWPDVPARVLAASQKAAESAPLAREAEARKLFHEADDEFRSYGSRPAALPKFQKLASDYADTAFVRRNRASIQSRGDGGREYFFAPADLQGSGSFKPTRHPDGRLTWTLTEDVPDKARKPDQFVELEFGALAEAEYRMWVFAGACCQETFAFFVQATDLPGAEPGGPAATPVPISIPFLKKTHAIHGGRKEPSRWDWIQVPIPQKFAAAGPKKVRLFSDQQGFSVAWAVVSTQRRAPPKEGEAKEMERSRPPLVLRPAGATATGSILREWWTNIPGDHVPDLTSNLAYPNKPTGSELLPIFEGPTNIADDYGTRIRGYIHPPQSGPYTFWTATDDGGDLFLSTSEDPAQKVKIAYQTFAVRKRDWNATPTQRSNAINLVRGRRYYIELLHKEGKGDDHCAVGWQLPDGTMERPIPGKRLSAWIPGGRGAGVAIQSPPAGTILPAPAKIDLAGQVFGGLVVARAEVYQGSTRLGETKSGTLAYSWLNVPAGAYPLLLHVTDKSGGAFTSAPVPVQVGELFFYRGINLNGPPLTIDGNPWEGREAGLIARGAGFEFPDLELKPPTDPDRAQMIRSSITSPEGTSVTLSAVPSGTFQVYLTLWGGEGDPKTFDLLVKGKVAHAAYAASPGRWDRLGPWTVEVTDGSIDVRASRAGACFSGIEVWSVGQPAKVPSQPTPTLLVGGQGGGPFEEITPDRSLLIGLRVTLYELGGGLVVKTFQPVFQKGDGRFDGTTHGFPQGNPTEFLAKPGYAVGGIVARGAARVDGFKVVFMKVSGPRLIPTDRYESDWIGGKGGNEMTLGCDGSPVIGLLGRQGSDTDAIGLIILK
jgi:hypothetical protein